MEIKEKTLGSFRESQLAHHEYQLGFLTAKRKILEAIVISAVSMDMSPSYIKLLKKVILEVGGKENE